jgi:hypothetical protein
MSLAVDKVAPHEGEPCARENHDSVINYQRSVTMIRCDFNGDVRTMIFFMMLSFQKKKDQ